MEVVQDSSVIAADDKAEDKKMKRPLDRICVCKDCMAIFYSERSWTFTWKIPPME